MRVRRPPTIGTAVNGGALTFVGFEAARYAYGEPILKSG
jgi:hypothetical protein